MHKLQSMIDENNKYKIFIIPFQEQKKLINELKVNFCPLLDKRLNIVNKSLFRKKVPVSMFKNLTRSSSDMKPFFYKSIVKLLKSSDSKPSRLNFLNKFFFQYF